MNTAHLSSTKNTSPLAAFADQQIDWNLTPEMAVTLYLEWGNNDWRSEHPPVRSKSDVATYFVVDAWQDPLKVRLVRRNSESADDLVTVPLPEPVPSRGSLSPCRSLRTGSKRSLVRLNPYGRSAGTVTFA